MAPSSDAPSIDYSQWKLGNAVGPGQQNAPADVLMIQKLLGIVIGDMLLGPIAPVSENGVFDIATKNAIYFVEKEYFYAAADPMHRIQPGDEMFRFLIAVAQETTIKRPPEKLSDEMYQLAAVMVPGGVDRVVKKKTQAGHIRTYLPDILLALDGKHLADRDMILMALATIRAESSGFVPIDEGVSKYNTSPVGTKGRHQFDLYDNRPDIGNTSAPDGADYKGRGFVQLTGKDNYSTIGQDIGVGDDLVNDPDSANDPKVAAQILAQYLSNHEIRIRSALKASDLRRARIAVNGGVHGLSDFVTAFNAGRRFLHLKAIVKAKQKARVGQGKTTQAVHPKGSAAAGAHH